MCTVTAHAFSPILLLSMMLVGVCLRVWPADPAARSHPLTCPSGRWRVPGTASPSPWWAHPWGTLGTARAQYSLRHVCVFLLGRVTSGNPSCRRQEDALGARIQHRPTTRADESRCAPRRRMFSGVEAEYGSFSCVPSCASSCQHP